MTHMDVVAICFVKLQQECKGHLKGTEMVNEYCAELPCHHNLSPLGFAFSAVTKSP